MTGEGSGAFIGVQGNGLKAIEAIDMNLYNTVKEMDPMKLKYMASFTSEDKVINVTDLEEKDTEFEILKEKKEDRYSTKLSGWYL